MVFKSRFWIYDIGDSRVCFFYNPLILLPRQPELIDWFEDLIYTGLLFSTATLLWYDMKNPHANALLS